MRSLFTNKRQQLSLGAHFLIDGYNVIKHAQFQQSSSLEHDRDALVAILTAWQPPWLVDSIRLVFDARGNNALHTTSATGRLITLFAAGSADDYIKNYVRTHRHPETLTIITNDASIHWAARDCGANHITVEVFLASYLRKKSKRSSPRDRGSKSDKNIPSAAQKAIADELRSHWNIT